jgi:hypothetical protein
MYRLYDYTVTKTLVTDEYIDFLVESDATNLNYSFFYRNIEDGRFFDDAVLLVENADRVDDNVIFGAPSEFSVRWYYASNDVVNSDLVEIEFRPHPKINLYGNTHGQQYVINTDGGFFSYEALSADGNVYDDLISLSGTSLFYNGTEIRSDLSSPSYASSFLFNDNLRVLVADTGNGRVLEVDSVGTTINVQSVSEPVFCHYDPSSGSVFVTDSDDLNVLEIAWKDVDTPLETSASFGTSLWNYNTAFPLNPLTSPRSATKSFDKNLVFICDDNSLIKIDRDLFERTAYGSFRFDNFTGDVIDNSFSPSNTVAYYDVGSDTEFSFQSSSSLLPFSASNHEALNRSLGKSSPVNKPRGLWNDFYYPVLPALPEVTNLTFDVLNKRDLNTIGDYWFFEKASEDQLRGDLSKTPVWGCVESHNESLGTQTLVCMTGMSLNCKMRFGGLKRGFARSGSDVAPVYVREFVRATLLNTSEGGDYEVLPFTELNGDVSFSFKAPEANEDSYARSQQYGAHYVLDLVLEVSEYYYDSDSFDNEVAERKTRSYHVPVYVFWWRQVFKEIDVAYNPVVQDFDLFDYGEKPEAFYERTKFPSFSRVVGTETLSLSPFQKRVVIYDNAIGLLSFYVGFASGESPRSNLFSLNPVAYEEARSNDDILHKRSFEGYTASQSRLFGLNADYQNSNIIDDDLGVGSGNTATLRDFPSLLFVKNGSLTDSFGDGGLLVNPALLNINSAKISLPNGSVRQEIEFDGVDCVVDDIVIASGSVNSNDLNAGETNLVVRFTTDDSPSEVSIAISIDGSPYSVVNDDTGAMREYVFAVDALTAGQFVDVVIVLGNGTNSIAYSKMERVITTSKTSAIGNLRVSRNKIGKTLKVSYDLLADRDYLPLNVSVAILSNGSPISVSDYLFGDLGYLLPGVDKRFWFNYGQYLTSSQIRSKITVNFTISSVDDSSVVGTDSISFFIEPVDTHVHSLNKTLTLDINQEVPEQEPIIDLTNVKDVSAFNFIPPGQYLYDISSSSSSSFSSSSSSSSLSESFSSSSQSESFSLSLSSSSSSESLSSSSSAGA